MIIIENLIPKGNTAAFYIQYIISTEVVFFSPWISVAIVKDHGSLIMDCFYWPLLRETF